MSKVPELSESCVLVAAGAASPHPGGDEGAEGYVKDFFPTSWIRNVGRVWRVIN